MTPQEPRHDLRRERIERRVFALLETRPAVLPAPAAKWRFLFLAAVVSVSAAAMALLVARIWLRPRVQVAHAAVITPVGGSSRLVVGDSVLDAGSDTWFEVKPGPDGAVTVVLARGNVAGDLAPRRAPFVVQAGDVKVTVTGAHFRISRRTEVTVDISRGTARVERGVERVILSPGQGWASGPDAAAAAR